MTSTADETGSTRSSGEGSDEWDEDNMHEHIKLNVESLERKIDFDEHLVSAAHARPRKTIDANHLSKVQRIDLGTAERSCKEIGRHPAKEFLNK